MTDAPETFQAREVPAGGHWNYRVVEFESDGEPFFEIMEVYYGADGEPTGFGSAHIGSEEISGLQWVLDRMREATEKEVLKEGDFTRHSDAQ